MFFIVSKILASFIKPTFWILLLLISSLFFKKRRKTLLIISVCAFWFFGNGYIVDMVYKSWEERTISVEEIEKTYDYGIVLGGFSGYEHAINRIEFNECGDRLFSSIQLYKLGNINKILISGGNGQLINEGYKEADWSKNFLIDCGIPEKDIVIENKSRNTWENAKFTSQILINEGDVTLLLITSAWHMKRASYCFTQNYMDVDKFSTDYTWESTSFDLEYILLPSSDSFEKWETLIKEMIGNLVYRIQY
jgi:uncharacterized SAM-binding protein YcdF (DUF218 family)